MSEYELVAGAAPNETILARGSLQGMENVRELVQRGNPKLPIIIREVKT